MASTYEGWKGIASALGRSVRTVQGWARKHGLPVRMLCGTAFLDADEYKAWRKKNEFTYLEHLERKSSPGIIDGGVEAGDATAEPSKAA